MNLPKPVPKRRGPIQDTTNFLRGEDVTSSKLNESQIKNIRLFFESDNYTKAELSRIFRVSKVNIGHIIARRSWKHIE